MVVAVIDSGLRTRYSITDPCQVKNQEPEAAKKAAGIGYKWYNDKVVYAMTTSMGPTIKRPKIFPWDARYRTPVNPDKEAETAKICENW